MTVEPEETRFANMMLDRHWRPVAFIGSGLSTKPDWVGFIKAMAKNLGQAAADRGLDQVLNSKGISREVDTLLAVADDLRSLFTDEQALQQFMEELFLQHDQRPPVFDTLVRAPFAFYITTNYNTHLEDAYKAYRSQGLKVFLSDKPQQVLEFAATGSPFVFKIHGCARLGGPYVIGASDYRRVLYGDPRLQLILEAIFAIHPIVFMGFGHQDPHIRHYVGRLQEVIGSHKPGHFTFSRRQGQRQSWSFVDHLKGCYGVDAIKIDQWSQIKDRLDQLTFLRLRDHWSDVMQEQQTFFKRFLEKGEGNPWDAVLYAYAASELGLTQQALELRDVIETNHVLKKRLNDSAALECMYHLVCGQALKRTGHWEDAKTSFDQALSLAQRGSAGVSAPLRGVVMRHAAILHLHDDRARDPEHQAAARRLLEEGEEVVKDFPEEHLDFDKWSEILRGDSKHGERIQAAVRLEELASLARKQHYANGEAWCLYNAGAQRWKAKPRESHLLHIEDLLRRGLERFAAIDHLPGQSRCHVLLAKLAMKRKDRESAQAHAKDALAFAMLTHHRPAEDKCRSLLQSMDVPARESATEERRPHRR